MLLNLKLLRVNHEQYVAKELRIAFLRKLYFKKRTTVPLKKYKKQKINCGKLIKRSVKHILTKINPKKKSLITKVFGKI